MTPEIQAQDEILDEAWDMRQKHPFHLQDVYATSLSVLCWNGKGLTFSKLQNKIREVIELLAKGGVIFVCAA